MASLQKFSSSIEITNAGNESLSQRKRVCHILREAIISGELKAGTQLKQDELAKHFKCSPGPIREALRDLESEGLVEHFLNRGVYVASITNDEIINVLLPIRYILESTSLREASKRFSKRDIVQLEDQIKIMKEGAKTKNIRMVNEADIKFHVITMEVAASDHSLQLWKSVLSRIRLEFYRLGPQPTLSQQEIDHRILLDVLLSGIPSKIDKALHEHIITTVTKKLNKSKGIS
jgi:DNA-binding GntR family transcriptional regulator